MENSKEKQIEEMASIINLPCSGHCEECPSLDCGCLEKLRAVSLYNAGYRKSTDLAEEIFAEIEEMVITEKSNDGCALYLDKVELAELKKKYTEDKGRDKLAEFGKYSPLSWKYTEDK